jgi:Na+/proline symporter
LFNFRSFALNVIDGFKSPLKSSIKYVAFNLAICVLLSFIWVLLTLFLNSEFAKFVWSDLWDNLRMYKEVGIFIFFALLYLAFYFKRANVKALFASIALKSVTTLYMINLMIVTLSKPLFDYSILDAEKWMDILPWKAQYPYSAFILLTFIWGMTWYSTLKQREIMKKENSNYSDIYDQAITWLRK